MLLNKDWLKFSRSNTPEGNAAHLFSTSCALTQIIDCPTRFPDNPNDTPHLLGLFPTTAPSYYSFSISAPLGNSDHNLIKIKSPYRLSKTRITSLKSQRNKAFSQSQLA